MRFLVLGPVLGALMVPGAVHAQQSGGPLLDTTLRPSYDRGRNVSVMDRSRPEYEALGINLGGFTAFPSVQIGAGETNNVLVTATQRRHDGFASVQPRLIVQSNWSVHAFRLDAGGNLLRYFNNEVRNEDGWRVSALGRFDATPDISLTLNGGTARQYESRFSSESLDNSRGAAPYQNSSARLLGKYEFGRTRIEVATNYNRLNYMDVRSFNGGTISQDQRDRDAIDAVVHVERALTPDASVFAEGTYTDINYSQNLANGVPNRDSHEWKGMAGISFDLAAPFRGSLAFGFVHRDFQAQRYQNVWGTSVAGRIEWFPSPITTVTFDLSREIKEANRTLSSAYFANVAAIRVDHELLRNLLLNAGVGYQIDDYFSLPGTVKIFRSQGGAKYMLSNSIAITADLRYSKRDSTVPGIDDNIAERRAALGILLQR